MAVIKGRKAVSSSAGTSALTRLQKLSVLTVALAATGLAFACAVALAIAGLALFVAIALAIAGLEANRPPARR